ncbi:unnamed protein product [Somion occarium]
MWAASSAPTRGGGWGRGGDPGSAFRGISRGRPGRGGGGGRGGRGGRASSGRGGAPSTRADQSSAKANTDQSKSNPSSNPTSVSKQLAPPPSTSPTQSTASSKSSQKPKPPSRKPSEQKGPRRVPNGDSSSASGKKAPPPSAPSAAISGRGNGRRKRSQSQNKPATPSIAVTHAAPARKASLTVESAPSRLRPVTAKDVPPHLAPPDTPHFDIKHDIDALVERVRAVAMDRPNTPGSHIDWAGEDDDSLPDLDDWGVPSNTEPEPEKSTGTLDEAEKSVVISPILENTLKPLPTIADVDVSTPPAMTTSNNEVVTPMEQSSAKAATPELSSVAEHAQSTTERHEAQTEQEAADSQVSKPVDSGSPAKAPLHPSLPPKPTPSLDLSKWPQGGLAESIHAPSADARSKEPSPERGLAASMHAPSSTSSAPSLISSHKVPPAGRGGPFYPAHGRSQTVGRYKQPFSAPSGSFPGYLSDSDRPRRGDQAYHARTHSSPPTGPGAATRAHHTTRPVLTGDALSRLARSLGGPTRREPPSVVVVAKD